MRPVLAYDGAPSLGAALPAALLPGTGPVFDRQGRDGRDGGPFRSGDAWWLHVSRLDDGRILVLGTRGAEFDDLVGRLTGVHMTVTFLALLVLAGIALRAIRRALRPLDEIAATAAAIGSGDLSRRVEPDDPRSEAGRLGRALNAMLGQLEAAFDARARSRERLRRFVADASHELRTPVAAIRGYAELFRRGAAHRPDDLALVLSRIESEAVRMGALVEELLLARLDQGRPLEREPVHLAALAAQAVAAARAVEPDRPLTLEAEPVTVRGDAPRLRQVLDNLLANVRAHTPPHAPAAVALRAADGQAVLEVADRGPGLTFEQCDRVFERFYRADASRSRDHGGSGLGLAIVAAVAQAHGGTATARPRPGGGAVFTVRLPLAE